jgi:exonuclease SbcD
MLKILHTADWHVGQSLGGYPRLAEHRIALAQLVAIAAEEEVDAIIVAGDIFDTQSPKAEAETLVYETFARLTKALPQASIILVAGNHDQAARIEAPSPLYRAFLIHAIGSVGRREGAFDIDKHLIALRNRRGETAAYCLALPYPRAVDLPGLASGGDEEGSPTVREVRRLYAEATEAALSRSGGLPVIATGHLHVLGAIESEGAERAIIVGGQHAAPADIFDPRLAYVALGHLHRPQRVGRDTIRYSGSLFPLSATERGYEHGVSIVSIEGSDVSVRHRRIDRPAPFLRLPDTGAMAPDAAKVALAALALDPATPEGLRPLVQLSLRLEGPYPGLEAELDSLAAAFPIRFLGHSVELPPTAGDALTALDASPVPLGERDPADLFAAAFLQKHGAPPDAAHIAVFERALVAARGG